MASWVSQNQNQNMIFHTCSSIKNSTMMIERWKEKNNFFLIFQYKNLSLKDNPKSINESTKLIASFHSLDHYKLLLLTTTTIITTAKSTANFNIN